MKAAVLAALMTVVACGNNASPNPGAQQAASASPVQSPAAVAAKLQSIAVQPADLPGGLIVCEWSGDVGSYTNKVAPTDPGYAKQLQDLWQTMESGGAVEGWVQDLSVSEAACQGYFNGSAGLVIHATSIVVRFSDDSAALAAYANDTRAFIGPKAIAQGQTQTGTATGLGPNSTTVVANNFYAGWQKHAYYMLVVIAGIADADAKIALLKIDARVP
jgi:hypothetical protein